MLDHVFADAIGAIRSALEEALLERQAVEERFTTDALLGDTRWETSYSIPGEGVPPRVQADMTLLWPTWSQTSYRSWYLTGELNEIPAIEVEVAARAQRLRQPPEPETVLLSVPKSSPQIGRSTLERTDGATVEISYTDDLEITEYAIEITYTGALELEAEVLADGNLLDEMFVAFGSWVSSTLVQLSDSA